MVLQEVIQQAVQDEYIRAAGKYGESFNTYHEAFGVLFEELAEAMQQVEFVKAALLKFMKGLMGKDPAETLNTIFVEAQQHAENAAAEMIQVAAMYKKAGLTGKEHENE